MFWSGQNDPVTSRTMRWHDTMLAYLDAGTGSMIAGAVAAGAAGAATVGRMAWYKVSPKKRKKDAEAAEAAGASDAAGVDPVADENPEDVEADASS
jgi:hypothetical protein